MGTVSGSVVIFNIRRLRHAHFQGVSTSFVHVLPASVLAILKNVSIIKIGSGINEDVELDFEPFGVKPTPVIDISQVLKSLGPSIYPEIARTGQTGLGHLSEIIYNLNYKPRDKSRKAKDYRTYRLYYWPLLSMPPHISYRRANCEGAAVDRNFGLETVCQYPPCVANTEHRMRICPTLHSRCHKCKLGAIRHSSALPRLRLNIVRSSSSMPCLANTLSFNLSSLTGVFTRFPRGTTRLRQRFRTKH